MKAYERLLKYVTFRTPSDENNDTTPSSACQFELARYLKDEMEGLNLSDTVSICAINPIAGTFS
jgi:tripeptide aminopeptidase